MEINIKSRYVSEFISSQSVQNRAWIVILYEKRILLRNGENRYYIPEMQEIRHCMIPTESMEYIGSYDGHACWCRRLEELPALPANFELSELSELTKKTGDPGLFHLAGTANHILHWRSMNRYCGRCGAKTEKKKDERAQVCPACGNIIYPRIAPAVITAILHKDRILLAHNKNFRKGMYSLIAGYVEPGETLEQSVAREIKEEVGIKVKNIRYVSSQPWPFPDSLMMAFTAEYESGEIITDDYEITHAAWYTADCLPDIPSRDSIAGKMIRWYRDHYTVSLPAFYKIHS